MEDNYRPSEMEKETKIKRENIGFVQHVFWQITDVIRAFSRVRSYGFAGDFETNVQFLQDSIEATETLLISYLDDEYWAAKKEIINKPIPNFENVYANRLKSINKFDFSMKDEIEQNRNMYNLRKKIEKLREIFREIMKWCGKNKLLFQLDKDLEL